MNVVLRLARTNDLAAERGVVDLDRVGDCGHRPSFASERTFDQRQRSDASGRVETRPPRAFSRFRYGIAGPGHVPPGPASVSPCLLCAGTALLLTLIRTHGFVSDSVR